MAGTIYELFGYRAGDHSEAAVDGAQERFCPFLHDTCVKKFNDSERTISGVCAVKPMTSQPVICCPVRLYAEDYQVLRDVSDRAFGPGYPVFRGGSALRHARRTGEPAVAAFGKRWGAELRVPQRGGVGSYFVDWVLALLDGQGKLTQFCAVEVQTIDTTGNYKNGWAELMEPERRTVRTTVGLNYENVNKRILPQLIYKSQVLQRESLCKSGMFFVSPTPVYKRIMRRLGGEENLPKFPLQPASITFLAYDYIEPSQTPAGETLPLSLEIEHGTTVDRLQNAFNNVVLPDAGVYASAIEAALTERINPNLGIPQS